MDQWKVKHNKSYTRVYKIFHGIKQRCNNINATRYNSYGGRGIKCEWNSFEEFYRDMKGGYSDILTIDRINNDGNYCKSNCRWITNHKQQSNRSNNRLITFNNITKTSTQWCKDMGLNYGTVSSRLSRGWTIEKTFKI